jgi:hypothetical protein
LKYAGIPRTPHVEVRVHRRAVVGCGGVQVGRWLTVVVDREVMRGAVTGRTGLGVEL